MTRDPHPEVPRQASSTLSLSTARYPAGTPSTTATMPSEWAVRSGRISW